MPLGAATRCASEIESRGNTCPPGNHPVLRVKRFIFFQIRNDRRDPINHRWRGDLKSIFCVALLIGRRRCQFSHENDQILLHG